MTNNNARQSRFIISISPVVDMVNCTTLLVLGIALAVFSYPAIKFCFRLSSRVCLRIPRRNQFDQLRRNQFEGFATPQGVEIDNNLVLGRLDRIYKRTKAAIPRQIEIDK